VLRLSDEADVVNFATVVTMIVIADLDFPLAVPFSLVNVEEDKL